MCFRGREKKERVTTRDEQGEKRKLWGISAAGSEQGCQGMRLLLYDRVNVSSSFKDIETDE